MKTKIPDEVWGNPLILPTTLTNGKENATIRLNKNNDVVVEFEKGTVYLADANLTGFYLKESFVPEGCEIFYECSRKSKLL